VTILASTSGRKLQGSMVLSGGKSIGSRFLRFVASGSTLFSGVIFSDLGTFTILPMESGSWVVGVCAPKALINVRTVSVSSTGATSADFDILRLGDANEDNVINALDFSALARAFGKSTGTEGFDVQADFNDDGKISILDFTILAASYGQIGDVVSSDARVDLSGLKPAAVADALYSSSDTGTTSDFSSGSNGSSSGCNALSVAPLLGLIALAGLMLSRKSWR
jgi:hypothetical protein